MDNVFVFLFTVVFFFELHLRNSTRTVYENMSYNNRRVRCAAYTHGAASRLIGPRPTYRRLGHVVVVVVVIAIVIVVNVVVVVVI